MYNDEHGVVLIPQRYVITFDQECISPFHSWSSTQLHHCLNSICRSDFGLSCVKQSELHRNSAVNIFVPIFSRLGVYRQPSHSCLESPSSISVRLIKCGGFLIFVMPKYSCRSRGVQSPPL